MTKRKKHTPCYNCICLALCRPQSISILKEKCPLLEKYCCTDNLNRSHVSHITFSKWERLITELKGIDL